MANLKGISPIIAVVVLLLVTVSIAGAAWSYIAGYFGGIVSKGVEITSVECTDYGAVLYIHNIGNDKLYTANDITITRKTISGACDGNIDIVFDATEVGPNGMVTATDSNCTAAVDAPPRYTVIVGGRVQHVQVSC